MNEDDLIKGQAEDKINQSRDQYIITHTGFLDMHQQSIVFPIMKNTGETRCVFYGGYKEAERNMLVCLPDYATLENEEILVVLRVETLPGGRKLSHRDYLGSVVGLGLKREMIGDILVGERGADIIIAKEISEFLLANYSKAGKTSLKLTVLPIEKLKIPKADTETVTDTVASLRLDNVLASGFGLSRTKAVAAIKSGLVFLNNIEEKKIDRAVSQGDKLVFRGKGKIILLEIGGKSRKDRIYITIKKWL